ncbi:hypothetical protein CAPTEDRAFT_200175 [Capitella teleta]|uniref:Uncharacterized protein n=1 Tax=Capitella teleta TaxID=283909 RepID=R7T353_CAPTE|nr:hypothetical protein CAPTEDRAFT_200175 [Capitella teleta]|eukprot:ELT86976.1 hypothetical protein CAPTEDRAFT_200175 [Capitella teleta]
MRNTGMSRLYRRVVIKHFGSTKNFVIWTFAVVATIYFIDSFILTRDRLQSIVIGNQQSTVQFKRSGDALEAPAAANVQAPAKAKATPQCGLTEACPAGQYAYLVRSGYGRDNSPTICFNGETAFPDKKAGERGINIVVINGSIICKKCLINRILHKQISMDFDSHVVSVSLCNRAYPVTENIPSSDAGCKSDFKF